MLFAAAPTGPRAQPPANSPATVEVPSLDRGADGAIRLPGRWFPAPGAERAPAVVMLHGCGGAWSSADPGRLAQRYRDYARLLNREGVHALLIDSLTPRGERELCTQATASRAVTVAHRRLDALGAIQWLAARPDVMAARIGLLGWSHGGSTVLATINDRRPDAGAARASFAIAFYPGCVDELRRGFQSATGLLMLLGGADDWTPAGPCQQLAAVIGPEKGRAVVFEGAHHGFDGTAPVRWRGDVPNGARPGAGVHVGADPVARELAQATLREFLRERIATP